MFVTRMMVESKENSCRLEHRILLHKMTYYLNFLKQNPFLKTDNAGGAGYSLNVRTTVFRQLLL